MRLETVGRDCLFLNWALPVERLPRLEGQLRYDVVESDGERFVFASAALFRQRVLELPGVQFPKVSFPQLSLRLCTLDRDSVPSLYVCTLLMPAWAYASFKLLAWRPARLATFDYPRAGAGLESAPLRWRIKSQGMLDVTVTEGAMGVGEGPSLGDWAQCVGYFQRRSRWYLGSPDGLRRISVERGEGQAVPVAAEMAQNTLLSDCLESDARQVWPGLHSAWLSPEASFILEIGRAKERGLPERLPAPG